ncbi:MAG: rhomboid family intramembrane serine protease [Gammaproteobacteria bacterium]|nr:rhomboid family intramembrane serine protease [Gammaproteobacteria bacterium]
MPLLFLPYSAALHLLKKPYVTYIVMLTCVLLHQFQWDNRKTIELQAEEYCLSIKKIPAISSGIDVFNKNYMFCKSSLIALHEARDRHVVSNQILQHSNAKDQPSRERDSQIRESINKHYAAFKTDVPASLDGYLMYYPDETNVWKMITATFAHADWLHLIGNLLFFFAFATGVEGVINNKLKYTAIFMALLFICHISYSIYTSASDIAIPTLGLSGVVMGMMGVSAYLMPNARIKVLIWGYRFVSFYYIRAWILAVIYIGWDTFSLYYFGQNGGVNLVSHVSGGFAGFIIAFIFLRDRKQEAKEELAEEVDFQVSRKKDFNSYDLSSTYGRKATAERLQVRQSKKEYEKYMQEIYTLVNVHKDSEAVLLIMHDYSRYQQDYQLLQQVFERINDWGKSHTLLCTGRMLIDVLLEVSQYARAVNIVKQCQQASSGFVLADPGMTLLLVRYAIELHEYEVAYYLVHDADNRYASCVDITPMRISEAEICLMYVDKAEQGKKIIKQLLDEADNKYKDEVITLAKTML